MRASSFESRLPKLGLLAVLSFLGAALAPEAVMSRVAGQAPPPTISLTVTIRDFKGVDEGGHPDFERNNAAGTGGLTRGSMRTLLNYDRRPIFAGGIPLAKPGGNYQQWKDSMGRPICWRMYDSALGDTPGALDPTRGDPFTTGANFDQWYHDVPGVNLSMTITLVLNLQADGTYVYDDKDDPVYGGNGGFFPIDGQLFGNSAANSSHNFHFTTELHCQFTYDAAAGQIFKFVGDDDVWVFINGELVIDLGGTHSAKEQYVDLTRIGLADGEIYTLDMFHAERNTNSSNFRFQTNLVLENTPIKTMISAPFD